MTAGYSRHLFICHRQTLDEFSNRLINHRITQELAVPCEKRALRFIDIRLGRLNQTIAGINQQHGKGIGQRFFLRIAQKRPTGFPPLFVEQ